MVRPLAGAIGLLVVLVGSVQYHVTQGQRAQFLSRFLAPQVAELVTRRGLKSATDEKTLELSVVCCDLRGFTAFSAATSSKRVIGIIPTHMLNVQHWLNGFLVVEYERKSNIFAALVARSKYKDWTNFGMNDEGPILLQDHGHTVSFKNIKIREKL